MGFFGCELNVANPIKVALSGLKKASQLQKSAKTAVNGTLIKTEFGRIP
jgi:hypothetical protein